MTTSAVPSLMAPAGICKRQRMRSESVMSSFEARAFAWAISPSDMRTWICLGYRSIEPARPPSEFSKEARAVALGARGFPRRKRSRGIAEVRDRRTASGTSVPDAMTRQECALAHGGQELFRGLCTRNRPLALLQDDRLETEATSCCGGCSGYFQPAPN